MGRLRGGVGGRVWKGAGGDDPGAPARAQATPLEHTVGCYEVQRAKPQEPLMAVEQDMVPPKVKD